MTKGKRKRVRDEAFEEAARWHDARVSHIEAVTKLDRDDPVAGSAERIALNATAASAHINSADAIRAMKSP